MVQHFRQGPMGTITMDEERQARKAAKSTDRRSGEERRERKYSNSPWSVKGAGIIYANRRRIINPKGYGPIHIATPERRIK